MGILINQQIMCMLVNSALKMADENIRHARLIGDMRQEAKWLQFRTMAEYKPSPWQALTEATPNNQTEIIE